jgi:tripartite-type tricarboxylate transporter receptor subunit TctC
MTRSRFVAVVIALMVCCGAIAAQAQTAYPSRVVKIINPWPPGGPADLITRPMLELLSQRLGQPVVMENHPGANGTIGAVMVANAAPDGHTLLLANMGPTILAPQMKPKPAYDSEKDFAPITQAVSAPTIMIARSNLPFKTIPELITYAKAHPGKLNYASVGIGSTVHLGMEMLKLSAGIDMLHVPYKGSTPAVTDMLGGSIDLMFISIAQGSAVIKQGQLSGIAVSSKTRLSILPDLPTVAETVPGFYLNSWYGYLAPAKTPKDIVDRLSREMADIYTAPNTRVAGLMREAGLEPVGSTPAEYAKLIHEELAYWSKVVEKTGLSADK